MIMVDKLTPCPPSAGWRYPDSCRLFTTPDKAEEIHHFAREIGISSRWLKTDGPMPFYELTQATRQIAVRWGAKSVDEKTASDVESQWRAKK